MADKVPYEGTTRDQVRTDLYALLAEQLGVELVEVTPDASFVEDLNADSLDLVELIMALEEKFSQEGRRLEISDEDAAKIVTVQDAEDSICEFLHID